MQLRFNESQIRYYACKYLAEHSCYDKPVERIVDDVKGRGYLTKCDLITLSDWAKNGRNIRQIKCNSDDFVKEITGFALSSDTAERDRICYLRRLNGVGPAVASAILHWFHKDHYPIWSPPARNSVGIDSPKWGEWEAYVSFCRCLAKKNKVNMQTLDRALWKYSADRRA
ncbi:hypothetical protein C6502_01325 [Candidatus Poribacteria bacterium]|nr:MAG: hypothetical protein C6502_01325 [Candidatus Poribacteria bacterium]